MSEDTSESTMTSATMPGQGATMADCAGCTVARNIILLF